MTKHIFILFFSLMGINTVAVSAPYKGVGGQIEAYGRTMGTYFAALAFTEVCGEDITYKTESEETARNYLNANQNILNSLRQRLDLSAINNGGEKERLRLTSEIKNALVPMETQAKTEARKQVISKKSCGSILANLRKGLMDLKTLRHNEISLIMEQR